ncbi:MAG: glycosyltransferase family 2 protein [Candidatus Marinimicrobia bacterium]|nr:glycosyltransferase family 2 protein [Candidatus Neomarinimicrobiota bacterium]
MLSIIIVTYNSADTIEACLKAAQARIKEEYELIIVDNKSTDGTEKVIKDNFSLPVIKMAKNQGFSAGVNQGLARSKGDWILLLNPDTELQSYSSLLKRKGDIIGGKQVQPSGKMIASFGSFPKRCNTLLYLTKLSRFLPRGATYHYNTWNRDYYEKDMDVDWVSGGLMLIKREVFKKIGDYDDKFFLYLEDVDFCYRAKKADFKIKYTPTFKALHRSQSSVDQDRGKAMTAQKESFIYFFQKHYQQDVGRWVNIFY